MHFRRVCQVALTTGVLVVASACGDGASEPRSTARTSGLAVEAIGRSRPVTRDLIRRPHVVVDVSGALRAISHVLAVMYPVEPVPAVTAPPRTDARTTQVLASWPSSFQPCDGAYPPCWRVATESGGNYNAYNPTGCGGSGCFGKWQFSGEWACKLGLPCDLRLATPQQQDEAARLLWNGGAGCSNWSAC